jgi:hypothetical protein
MEKRIVILVFARREVDGVSSGVFACYVISVARFFLQFTQFDEFRHVGGRRIMIISRHFACTESDIVDGNLIDESVERIPKSVLSDSKEKILHRHTRIETELACGYFFLKCPVQIHSHQ